ncbi:MAG: aminopeptidase P N-terminal domain-containing protein [Bdellovibrionales bacterium]|nr:aminopeptidase P N-terminal domain-containing protein [Bdellovibrionales bacterium]
MLLTSLPPFFKTRRDALMKKTESEGAAFVFPAAREMLRNPDVTFPFRQESNFFYLSGFEEPEAYLVLAPTGGGKYKTVLFVRRRDPVMEIWEGERYGTEGALKVFGVDEAYLHDEFEKKLPELLKYSEKLYYRANHDEAEDRVVFRALEALRRSQGRSGKVLLPMADPNQALGSMRVVKQKEEIEFMKRACSITAAAHKAAMSEAKPGVNEFEIEAFIDYQFRKQGSQRVGYGSIVAGGKNACCLHYRANNEVLRDGDLLLVDAGAEYNYYTSDITRTFPVGKKFSKPQAAIYDLVLKAQLEAIGMAKPGASQAAIHRRASEILVEGALSLGLMKGKTDEIITSGQVKRFYPHGTGHWLGMDVHDIGLYQMSYGANAPEPRKLEPGMMFTIEPGFYIQPDDKDAPAEYRGIGVRIEDDILITAGGCEIMTAGVPKTREEIEALK